MCNEIINEETSLNYWADVAKQGFERADSPRVSRKTQYYARQKSLAWRCANLIRQNPMQSPQTRARQFRNFYTLEDDNLKDVIGKPSWSPDEATSVRIIEIVNEKIKDRNHRGI